MVDLAAVAVFGTAVALLLAGYQVGRRSRPRSRYLAILVSPMGIFVEEATTRAEMRLRAGRYYAEMRRGGAA